MSKNQVIKNGKKSKFLEYKINEYKEAFDIFDRDKTGIISTNDIIKIKKIFSYPISRNHIQKMINEIDVSGDGKMDFRKFVILMEKQRDYIDDKNQEMAMESFRNEFLGNKRKREELNNDITSIDDFKLNYRNNISKQNENYDKEISNRKEDNIVSNNNLNFKELKLDNKNINKNNLQIENNNINKDEKNYKYDNYNNNNNEIKNTNKQNKRKNLDGIKINNNSENKNIILINKINLPKEIIDQIESKKINDSLVKFENNNNISIRDNISIFKPPISNFNPKLDIEFDFNNISNINPRENSFVSDLSLDFLNNKQTYTPNNLNSKPEKTQKLSKDLVNKNENFIDIINETLISKDIDIKKNININNYDYYKNNQLKTKNHQNYININNNLYDSEKINNKKKVCFNNNIIIVYNKQLIDENNIKKDNNYPVDKNEIKDEIIKNESTSKFEEKKTKNNIQILNSFVFIYKKNKKREIIIKNAFEIPYLIIIEKKILEMDKIININQQIKIKSPQKKIMISSERKNNNNLPNKKEINYKNKNNYQIIEINKNESIFLKNQKIQIKNKEKKSPIKFQKEIKKLKIGENNQTKMIDKDKMMKNEKKEENKLLNIANIEFNSPIENICKVKPKEVKNLILQENTYMDDENYRNLGKLNNKLKNDNNKGKDVELNTIDLLNGFNYLYRQKIQ